MPVSGVIGKSACRLVNVGSVALKDALIDELALRPVGVGDDCASAVEFESPRAAIGDRSRVADLAPAGGTRADRPVAQVTRQHLKVRQQLRDRSDAVFQLKEPQAIRRLLADMAKRWSKRHDRESQ